MTFDNPHNWSDDRIRDAFDVEMYTVQRLMEVTGKTRRELHKILREG